MLKIPMKGKVETITADRVKPAHIEREPETCSTQKRQMQPKPISTAKKPAAIAHKPRTARVRSRCMTTQQSLKTGVNSDKIIYDAWSWTRSSNSSMVKYDWRMVA